jgi:hypothetical protein
LAAIRAGAGADVAELPSAAPAEGQDPRLPSYAALLPLLLVQLAGARVLALAVADAPHALQPASAAWHAPVRGLLEAAGAGAKGVMFTLSPLGWVWLGSPCTGVVGAAAAGAPAEAADQGPASPAPAVATGSSFGGRYGEEAEDEQWFACAGEEAATGRGGALVR